MRQSWRPETYLKFGDERLRPVTDLLSRVPLDSARRIVDLGCGTGSAFEILHRRYPQAELEGVDASASMLDAAQELCTRHDSLREISVDLLQCDIESWVASSARAEKRYDLIFSNAALHWVGDHRNLFPRLLTLLTPGGVLAVQMPRNWAEPSHALMRRVLKTLGSARAAELHRHLLHEPVAEARSYHQLLREDSDHLDVWETTYLHELHRPATGDLESRWHPVLDWVRGTALQPVLAALGPGSQSEERSAPNDDGELEVFLRRYDAALHQAYGAPSSVGDTDVETVTFPFRRIFLVARRPASS